jgi:hypothetical protein
LEKKLLQAGIGCCTPLWFAQLIFLAFVFKLRAIKPKDTGNSYPRQSSFVGIFGKKAAASGRRMLHAIVVRAADFSLLLYSS